MISHVPLECFPGRHLTVALCKPKTDLSLIKDNVLASGLVVINASLILDPFMLFAAANKALVAEKNGSMKTKSLNTELLYNLSPSLHVSDALKTFGLSPGLEYILFVAFDIADDEFKERLYQFATAEDCLELAELVHVADNERIFKMFKVTVQEDALNEIVSAIACKGI